MTRLARSILSLSAAFAVVHGARLDTGAQASNQVGQYRPHFDGGAEPPKSISEMLLRAALVRGRVIKIANADDELPPIDPREPPIVWQQTSVTVKVTEVFGGGSEFKSGDSVAIVIPGGERLVNGQTISSVPEGYFLPELGDELVVALGRHPKRKGSFTPMWTGNGLFRIRGNKLETDGRSPLSRELAKKGAPELVEGLRRGRNNFELSRF